MLLRGGQSANCWLPFLIILPGNIANICNTLYLQVCGDKFSALQDFIQHLSNEQHTVTKQARHTLMIPEGCERFDLFQLEPRSGDYHCMKCSKTCKSDVELYSHMGFHHKAKRAKPEVKISQPAEQQSPMVNPTVLKSPPSKYPSKPLIKNKLPVPKKPVPEEQEHVPKPSPKKKDAFDSMFSSTETCTICKKSLPSKKLLQIHMAAHKSQFLRDLKPEVGFCYFDFPKCFVTCIFDFN